MPEQDDTTTTDDAQAATADAAAQAAAQATQDGGADTSDDDKPISASEAAKLRKELTEARKEAAGHRVKLKEYETAQLSEQQKLEKERDDARDSLSKTEARVRELQTQVLAAKLGVRAEAAGDVASLLDWDAITDPTDDKQVEKAIRELVKEKPYLSGRPDGLDGGTGRNGIQKPASMTDLIRSAAGR